MALPEPSTLAALAALVVAILAGTMAYLGVKSYRNTGNVRLVFVVLAFLTFVIKSLFTGYNVVSHAVPHDSIEFVVALFDVVIVLLLFIPFFLKPGR